MKTCSRCNFENDDDADYCVECGANIKTKAAAPHEMPSLPLVGATDADDTTPPDGSLLCTSCLHPNPPETPFCKRCGAPIGAISAVGPLEHIYAEGFAYRQATEGRPKTIVLVGMWLLFLPPLVLALPLMAAIVNDGRGSGAVFELILILVLAAISAAILIKVTLNYFKQPPAASNDEPGYMPPDANVPPIPQPVQPLDPAHVSDVSG
jgi:hypothetical protein